jgi:hypothetical protein
VSFSFSASGTLEETVASLKSETNAHMSEDGQDALQLILGFLEDAPSDVNGKVIPYSVSASGHRGTGPNPGTPSLNIQVFAPYVNPSASAGGV